MNLLTYFLETKSIYDYFNSIFDDNIAEELVEYCIDYEDSDCARLIIQQNILIKTTEFEEWNWKNKSVSFRIHSPITVEYMNNIICLFTALCNRLITRIIGDDSAYNILNLNVLNLDNPTSRYPVNYSVIRETIITRKKKNAWIKALYKIQEDLFNMITNEILRNTPCTYDDCKEYDQLSFYINVNVEIPPIILSNDQ
jgi:hypothetical protein